MLIIMEKSMVFIAIFVISINFVSAFAVSSLYSDYYPLRLRPGEVKETFFLIRNTAEGDSDTYVKTEIIKGAEIATLIDGPRSYDLPFGSEAEVHVRIEVPKDAKAGDEFKVGAMFRPVPRSTGQGNIEFIVNLGKSFPVLIVDDSGEAVKRESDKKEKDISSITIEEDEGDIVETLAPFTRSFKGVWLGMIFFVIVGIIIVGILIILVLRRKSSGNQEVVQQEIVDENAVA